MTFNPNLCFCCPFPSPYGMNSVVGAPRIDLDAILLWQSKMFVTWKVFPFDIRSYRVLVSMGFPEPSTFWDPLEWNRLDLGFFTSSTQSKGKKILLSFPPNYYLLDQCMQCQLDQIGLTSMDISLGLLSNVSIMSSLTIASTKYPSSSGSKKEEE